ncbi:MAG: hypothetical protein RR054_03900 [Clostridia bacterium]
MLDLFRWKAKNRVKYTGGEVERFKNRYYYKFNLKKLVKTIALYSKI